MGRLRFGIQSSIPSDIVHPSISQAIRDQDGAKANSSPPSLMPLLGPGRLLMFYRAGWRGLAKVKAGSMRYSRWPLNRVFNLTDNRSNVPKICHRCLTIWNILSIYGLLKTSCTDLKMYAASQKYFIVKTWTFGHWPLFGQKETM